MGTIRKDLTGQRFGRLKVIRAFGTKIVGKRREKLHTWECLCDCGTVRYIPRPQLISGKTKSCGCLLIETRGQSAKGVYKNIAGKRFNQLTAVAIGPPIYYNHSGRRERGTRWIFQCDCGNQRLCTMPVVRGGSIKNCGKHRGWSKHPLYATWYGIKSRCSNSNQPSFENYGGRGISMCDRWWNSFLLFAEDISKEIGIKPSSAHTMDRINNDGHYEPGNVRWATAQEQSDNQRPRKIIAKFSDEEIRAEFLRRKLVL